MANAVTHAIKSLRSRLRSSQTKWLDLPIPITELILERLPPSDYIRFGSVCKHWYAIKKQHLKRYSPFAPPMQKPIPWLIPCLYTEEVNIIPVFSPSEKKCYHFSFPENRTPTFCFASSHGWFFFLDINLRNGIYLFNPVSKSLIEFPQLISIHPFHNITGVLSTSPPLSPGSVALILERNDNTLYLCWLGQEQPKWTFLKVTYDGEDPYATSWYTGLYYNDKFYCITNCFFVIDSVSTTPTVHVLNMDCSQLSTEKYQRQTLVEFDGEILMVVWIYDPDYETVRWFEVFRAEFSKMTWVRVKSLGDCALFMGGRGSLCVSASDVGCKSNCVYFMNWSWTMECLAVGVFDMGTMERSYHSPYPFKVNRLLRTQFGHWFFPSLR